MKILFVIKSALYFTYFESAIRCLLERGHTIELHFYKKHSTKYPQYALDKILNEDNTLKVYWTQERNDSWYRPIKFIRELNHYSFVLSQPHQDDYHINLYLNRLTKKKFLKKLFSIKFIQALLKLKLIRKLFLYISSSATPLNKNIYQLIENFNPDIVLATPVNFTEPEELDYLEAVERLGKKSIIPVLSWDNLTIKGCMQFIPDYLFVWNEHQMDEAIEYHNVPEERIVVAGSTFFDKWFNLDDYLFSRSELFERLNIDQNKQYVIYLGSAPHIGAEEEKFNDESWLPLNIAEAMVNSDDLQINSLELVVRPHGGNQEYFTGLEADNITLWLRDEVLPDSEESFKMYASALYYSTCTIGLNTTAMIDSIMAGTPTVSMIIDEYKNSSTLRAIYFLKILEYEIYNIANDIDKCLDLINSFLKNINPKEDNRDNFIKSFVRPRGIQRNVGRIFSDELENIHIMAR